MQKKINLFLIVGLINKAGLGVQATMKLACNYCTKIVTTCTTLYSINPLHHLKQSQFQNQDLAIRL